MRVEVATGGRALVGNGALLLAPGSRTFSLTIEDLTFQFEFFDDVLDGGADPSMDFVDWGTKTGKIVLKGYNNVLGVANLLPDLATIGQRQVSVGLVVNAIGNESQFYREVSYSVYASAV